MDSAARLGVSRFGPPQQHVQLIQRPALTSALEDGLHKRMVLLHAPAGYGKSTLMSQWRDSLAARGVRVVWLTLDEDFSSAAAFLSGLILAAGFAGIQVADLDGATLPLIEPQNLRAALTALLGELGRDETPITFILDDYYLAQTTETDALLDLFIRRLPAHAHLVLASRSRPGLALPQLRAQGQVREVGAEQLRFSLAEAFDLLRAYLPDDDIVALVDRLEGWPIALQLAAIWVRNHGGGTGLLQAFSGSQDDMGDYLATQVFAQVPVHLQNFLLETSIFDRFNSRAADAVREAMDSALLMEQLRRFDSLLIPVDDTRTWWRHHRLVGEFLTARCGQLGAARLRQMHERASAWFEAEGALLDAVRHARAAQDRPRMVALIEDARCMRLCLEQGFSRARELFALLTPAEIEGSVHLCLVDALALFQDGKLRAGDAKLAQVRQMPPPARGGHEAFRGDLVLVLALRAGYGEALLSAVDQAALDALCARNLDSDPWFGGFLNNIGCVLDLRRGEIESARLGGQKALDYFGAAASPYGCVFMNVHLAKVAIAQGRLVAASDHLQTAEDLVLEHFPRNMSVLSIVRTVAAEVAYARNDIARAAHLLTETLTTITSSEGWPELYASGFATAVLLSLAQGDSAAAEATLATAVELLGPRELPQLTLFLMACRANLLGRTGRVAEAHDILAEVETALAANHAVTWSARDEYALAKARLLLAEGLPEQALPLLDGVVSQARRQGRIHSAWRAETLRVLALAALGEEQAAAQTLRDIVEQTGREGERRLFIDEGSAMAERLRDLLRRRWATPLSSETLDYVTELSSGFTELMPGDAKAHLLGTLTPREREILRALVRGGSNKVIARAVDLNENAVKFHLKNIFRKLGVADRAMAVTMTEKLELLG